VIIIAVSIKAAAGGHISAVTAARHSASATHAAGGRGSGPPAAPHSSLGRWRSGLTSLRRQMVGALGTGTITIRSLRQTAAALRRCTPELTALGRPSRLVRPAFRLARRACAAFAQGANLAVAAARAYPVYPGPKQARLSRLLNQMDAAVNHGINLIYSASYGVPG
jgi:hypothetical protein